MANNVAIKIPISKVKSKGIFSFLKDFFDIDYIEANDTINDFYGNEYSYLAFL